MASRRSSLTQISIPTVHQMADRLRNEYVVTVTGMVTARPDGSANPHIPTGAIEIKANELVILNEAKPLPFPLDDSMTPSETLRLKHRYLDLRRPKMQELLQLRSQVSQVVRQYFHDKQFIEVETPILNEKYSGRRTGLSRAQSGQPRGIFRPPTIPATF